MGWTRFLSCISVILSIASLASANAACPNDCSTNGICLPSGICLCDSGAIGMDCSIVQDERALAARMRLSLVWEGMQNVVQSQALINREVCSRLERIPGVELSLRSFVQDSNPFPSFDSRLESLMSKINRALPRVPDVHVRHQWFANGLAEAVPVHGRLVLWHPWEFCALPTSWLHLFRDVADEIWVYSSYNRDCYIESGISASKIFVIPLGFDPTVISAPLHRPPDLRLFPLKSRKSFRFLYVGGTLNRKGIVELLDAYLTSFTASDDVVLVIKDLAPRGYYSGLAQTSLVYFQILT